MKAVLHEKGGAFITLQCRHRGATTDAIGTPLKLPLKLGGYGQMRGTFGGKGNALRHGDLKLPKTNYKRV